MGFSGGGANILKPHTHDSGILQDGGSLDFDNITQSSMANGSLTYSNTAHLQELAIGSTGDTLAVSGGVPAWIPHGDYPVVELLGTYTGSASIATVTISPAVDLATDYSEIWFVANLYTNSGVGFGDTLLLPNANSGSVYANTYGYSFDGTTFSNIVRVATTYHLIADAALTTTNSGMQIVSKLSLAKTSTTTNTLYLKTDSISDQGLSEHFEDTMNLGGTTLSSIQIQASLSSWGTGSNINIYGVKI